MSRTPAQTQRGVERIFDHHKSSGGARHHIPAPPELAERLRHITCEFTSALGELQQLAIDLSESSRHTLAFEVAMFSSDAGTHLERDGHDGYQPAQDRVTQILNGTWEDHSCENG